MFAVYTVGLGGYLMSTVYQFTCECTSLCVCRYCLVREAKKPTFVRLDKSSNEELKTNTKSICEVRCV